MRIHTVGSVALDAPLWQSGGCWQWVQGHCIHLIRPRKLGHLEVNCPIGAREATLGCLLKEKVNPVFLFFLCVVVL